MIVHIANLVRWEWFKLQRRWMPWILLGVMLVFSQMPIWGVFFDYRNRLTGEVIIENEDGKGVHTGLTCAEIRAGLVPTLPEDTKPYVIQGIKERCEIASIAMDKAIFTLPDSLTFQFGFGQVFGMQFLAILIASMLGTEYSWGTLRTVLVRGTGRWQYLMSKFIMILLFAAGVGLVVGVAAVLSSLLATSLAPEPPHEVADWLAAHSAGWSGTIILIGRACIAILPYLALAAFITVFTTSLATGIAVSVGYYFVEAIGALLIVNVLKLGSVADYLLVRNIGGWMLGSKDQVLESETLTGLLGFGKYPSQVHAILVMLAYLIFFLALSFWLFRRRDVAGASGG